MRVTNEERFRLKNLQALWEQSKDPKILETIKNLKADIKLRGENEIADLKGFAIDSHMALLKDKMKKLNKD
jgi:hypothetical protein